MTMVVMMTVMSHGCCFYAYCHCHYQYYAELLATPFGQPGARRLLTELSCSPKMPLSLSGRLLELALVLANSVTSDTVGVVLFAVRIAVRVESATSLLLRAHSGGITSSPLLAASLNMSECRAQEEGSFVLLHMAMTVAIIALLCSSNCFSSIVLYMGGQSSKGGMTAELIGKDPPDFEMTLEDGSTKKLSDFLKAEPSKPVIIDFYANF
eukprot:s2023_g8.t1